MSCNEVVEAAVTMAREEAATEAVAAVCSGRGAMVVASNYWTCLLNTVYRGCITDMGTLYSIYKMGAWEFW